MAFPEYHLQNHDGELVNLWSMSHLFIEGWLPGQHTHSPLGGAREHFPSRLASKTLQSHVQSPIHIHPFCGCSDIQHSQLVERRPHTVNSSRKVMWGIGIQLCVRTCAERGAIPSPLTLCSPQVWKNVPICFICSFICSLIHSWIDKFDVYSTHLVTKATWGGSQHSRTTIAH